MELELNSLIRDYGNFSQEIENSALNFSSKFLNSPNDETYNTVYTTCVNVLGKLLKHTEELCHETIDMLDKQSETIQELSNGVETLMIVMIYLK